MTVSSTLEAKLRGRAQITLPALEVAPPAIFWGAEEVAIDAFHHAVYAAAAGTAYELISNGHNGG